MKVSKSVAVTIELLQSEVVLLHSFLLKANYSEVAEESILVAEQLQYRLRAVLKEEV